MDALQLVNGNVAVLSVTKGAKELTWYNTQSVIDKYGLKPEQLRDYKGLMGDSSDNIPGVPGVGPKTAQQLLSEFGTLEALYEALETASTNEVRVTTHGKTDPELVRRTSYVVKDTLRTKLLQYKAQAFLSKELGTIDIHVPIELDLAHAIAKNYHREKAATHLESLGFKSLIRRLPEQIVMVKQESLF
jgi:DNA polymerase-1